MCLSFFCFHRVQQVKCDGKFLPFWKFQHLTQDNRNSQVINCIQLNAFLSHKHTPTDTSFVALTLKFGSNNSKVKLWVAQFVTKSTPHQTTPSKNDSNSKGQWALSVWITFEFIVIAHERRSVFWKWFVRLSNCLGRISLAFSLLFICSFHFFILQPAISRDMRQNVALMCGYYTQDELRVEVCTITDFKCGRNIFFVSNRIRTYVNGNEEFFAQEKKIGFWTSLRFSAKQLGTLDQLHCYGRTQAESPRPSKLAPSRGKDDATK